MGRIWEYLQISLQELTMLEKQGETEGLEEEKDENGISGVRSKSVAE